MTRITDERLKELRDRVLCAARTRPLPEVISALDELIERRADDMELSDGARRGIRCAAKVLAAAGAPAVPAGWRHSLTHCLYETEEEVPLADGDEWAEPLYLAAAPTAPAVKAPR